MLFDINDCRYIYCPRIWNKRLSLERFAELVLHSKNDDLVGFCWSWLFACWAFSPTTAPATHSRKSVRRFVPEDVERTWNRGGTLMPDSICSWCRVDGKGSKCTYYEKTKVYVVVEIPGEIMNINRTFTPQ